MQNQKGLPSRLLRQKRYGIANQLSYQASEAADREALRARVGGRPAAKKRKPADSSGMSSGLMGSTLRAEFFKGTKDKGRSGRR